MRRYSGGQLLHLCHHRYLIVVTLWHVEMGLHDEPNLHHEAPRRGLCIEGDDKAKL